MFDFRSLVIAPFLSFLDPVWVCLNSILVWIFELRYSNASAQHFRKIWYLSFPIDDHPAVICDMCRCVSSANFGNNKRAHKWYNDTLPGVRHAYRRCVVSMMPSNRAPYHTVDTKTISSANILKSNIDTAQRSKYTQKKNREFFLCWFLFRNVLRISVWAKLMQNKFQFVSIDWFVFLVFGLKLCHLNPRREWLNNYRMTRRNHLWCIVSTMCDRSWLSHQRIQ